ncbi:MAG: DUF2480 family protein [Chitinophagaceae bacterium]|jgi:hypothetical protein|nr:DUF2480 family protein [Chitinophagaceae bacterium]
MEEAIINKVAESGIVTIDLGIFFPKEEILLIDIKDFLFMGLILKEKDFRAALQNKNWEEYRDKYVGIICSADAIIPRWAYMLLACYLKPLAKGYAIGERQAVIDTIFIRKIAAIRPEEYEDKRVVIKGCGKTEAPETAYLEITNLLLPFAKSIMYGEPCSTVPVFKRK